MPRKQKFPHLVQSKWTAHQKIDGWRHFQVTNRKNQGQWVFAEVVAACDPTVRFWVNARLLQDRSLWQAGWQSLQEQARPEPETTNVSPAIAQSQSSDRELDHTCAAFKRN